MYVRTQLRVDRLDVLEQFNRVHSGGGVQCLHWLQLYHQEEGSSPSWREWA